MLITFKTKLKNHPFYEITVINWCKTIFRSNE